MPKLNGETVCLGKLQGLVEQGVPWTSEVKGSVVTLTVRFSASMNFRTRGIQAGRDYKKVGLHCNTPILGKAAGAWFPLAARLWIDTVWTRREKEISIRLFVTRPLGFRGFHSSGSGWGVHAGRRHSLRSSGASNLVRR